MPKRRKEGRGQFSSSSGTMGKGGPVRAAVTGGLCSLGKRYWRIEKSLRGCEGIEITTV